MLTRPRWSRINRANRSHVVPVLDRVDPRPGGPAGTPDGVRRDRDTVTWGATTHPARAACLAHLGLTPRRRLRPAGVPAPSLGFCTPRRYARGALVETRDWSSDRSPESLPPHSLGPVPRRDPDPVSVDSSTSARSVKFSCATGSNGAASERMSMRQPVRRAASRAF